MRIFKTLKFLQDQIASLYKETCEISSLKRRISELESLMWKVGDRLNDSDEKMKMIFEYFDLEVKESSKRLEKKHKKG